MALSVFVRDDLVQTGWTEDGDADIARRFFLVAQDGSGARWAHDYGRLAYRGNADQVEAEHMALCATVAAHLAAGGKLDPDHWNEIDPAYGSAAYQRLDAGGYFRAAERARERDAGENVPIQAEDAAIELWEDRPVSRAV